MVKEVEIGCHGLKILVDDADYEMASQVHWQAFKRKSRNKTYVYAMYESTHEGKRARIFLHRLLLGLTDRKEICDHINHNTLDNRRENLRKCTHSENMRNSVKHFVSPTSPYKGVSNYGRKGWWKACISVNNKQSILGVFKAPEEAARCYDAAARQHHGEFAKCNFEA